MKKIIIIFLSVITLTSCELVDVLDKKPPYQADLSGAIVDQKSVELALLGTYAQLPSTGFNVQFPLCAGSFSAGTLERQSFINKGNSVYYSERYWPILSWLTDPEWDNCYALIKNANLLLDAIENRIDENAFTGNRRDEIIGELHFLKALSYTRLLMRYAQYWDQNSNLGLILREELPTLESIVKSRSTVKESYQIINDLLDVAIAKAPAYTSGRQASSLAAKALKTRVLFMAQRYSEAITLANDVLSEATLEPSYANVFNNGTETKEVLFGRYFGKTEADAKSILVSGFSDAFWGPSENFLRILGSDPRYSTIIRDGVTVTWYNTPYPNRKTIKKYLNAANDMPIMYLRTAEILLIKAESIFRSDGSITDAYAPVKILRERAGATIAVPSTKEQLSEAIFNEWIIELSFENWHEWFACQRFNKILQLNASLSKALADEYAKSEANGLAYLQRIKDRWIMPIPSSEISSNPVTQNPGY
jgi:starch-binding outer membrane protein, SusD/RagB family